MMDYNDGWFTPSEIRAREGIPQPTRPDPGLTERKPGPYGRLERVLNWLESRLMR